jgi:glycosyltransferase involved in cell wall biosynthesis
MHIGFLTPEYVLPGRYEGGLANYIHKVGQALTGYGHQVTVFVLSNRNAKWQDGHLSICEVKRMHWRRWVKGRQYLNLAAQWISARRIASAVWRRHREAPFDILQTSSYATPGYALRRNGRIPLVCRVSSYTPMLRSAYGHQRSLGNYLADWLEIRQVLDAEAAFAPSLLVSQVFSRLEGYKLEVIHTPLELVPEKMEDTFYRQHLAGEHYLLYFGTLSRIKGIDILAEAAPRIFEKYPAIKLVMIGRDDALPDGMSLMANLRIKCQRYEDRILYFEPIPRNHLYPVIAHAEGVLMPSRIDNYPNACLEALTMGVPVVGTYGSSLDEIIVDGKTGYLVENADPQSLLRGVERLLDRSQVVVQEMRMTILETIAEMQREDLVMELIKFYQRVIQDRVRK